MANEEQTADMAAVVSELPKAIQWRLEALATQISESSMLNLSPEDRAKAIEGAFRREFFAELSPPKIEATELKLESRELATINRPRVLFLGAKVEAQFAISNDDGTRGDVRAVNGSIMELTEKAFADARAQIEGKMKEISKLADNPTAARNNTDQQPRV